MELAKILPDGTVDLRHCTSKECEKYKELKQKGFLEFISEAPPQITLEQIATNSFDIIKERIIQKLGSLGESHTLDLWLLEF